MIYTLIDKQEGFHSLFHDYASIRQFSSYLAGRYYVYVRSVGYWTWEVVHKDSITNP